SRTIESASKATARHSLCGLSSHRYRPSAGAAKAAVSRKTNGTATQNVPSHGFSERGRYIQRHIAAVKAATKVSSAIAVKDKNKMGGNSANRVPATSPQPGE